jgi:hypothetical protein
MLCTLTTLARRGTDIITARVWISVKIRHNSSLGRWESWQESLTLTRTNKKSSASTTYAEVCRKTTALKAKGWIRKEKCTEMFLTSKETTANDRRKNPQINWLKKWYSSARCPRKLSAPSNRRRLTSKQWICPQSHPLKKSWVWVTSSF